MKRVILLSGHNYIEKGSYNKKLNVSEFDVVHEITLKVFSRFFNKDVDLILKARNDYGNLTKEVNSLNGDYLITVHTNAYNSKVQGTETLIGVNSSKAPSIAPMVQGALCRHLGLNDRGVKVISPGERGSSILNNTKPVAFLLEPFFIDEIESLEELEDVKEKTVKSILEILDKL